MEKQQRSKLQTATQDARKLLEEEFRSQLLQTYDIDVEKVRWAEEPGAHLQAEQRLIRDKLVAWIEHKEAQIHDRKEALLLALREMAFTALNRFVALKLMEARELVRPCVSGGLESAGFLEFTAVAQGLLADQESSYRLYLETIFEDLGRELRALFDPRDPASLLWPKRAALLELLDILNRPELAELWIEDETLGWVYQYFNGDAERKKMREESSAPRNSRELAVRNQFFTPRYVVEFLTDNTLGRIWYDMRQGKTGLKNRCRYLVRRPNEVWLQPGEEPPAQADADEGLNQEELLRQPVYIPHRPLKDPREIRMLDPACGSMHFGLYAFDLYLEIYNEAWEIAQGSDEQIKRSEAFALFVEYIEGFADKAAFLREVPGLILRHNIHGIDIDPRATQIARLTLWLRAQRAWKEQQLLVADRPPITRSNVVCAEPMPGKRELLADFVDHQFPEAERGLVQQLLEEIFDKMQLAGEAGSLLKIEDEIRDAIDQARREWQKHAVQQRDLFSPTELAALGQIAHSLNTDLQNLANDFWIDIEERIYVALSDYADQAESGSGLQRRLFAEDAAQGFALIDVCRKRYDVALMNPPFGEASVGSRSYLYSEIKSSTQDIFAAFVERFAEVLSPLGSLGVISNRSALFKELLTEWRSKLFFGSSTMLRSVADLGYGVLDAAVVEAAAYVLQASTALASGDECSFFTALDSSAKQSVLRENVSSFRDGSPSERCFCHRLESFAELPNQIISYWCSEGWLKRISYMPSAGSMGVVAKKGLETGDDNRLLRLLWELPPDELISLKRWTAYSKGGGYRPFYSDLHLAFDFKNREIARRTSNEEHYGSAGLTYTERTTSNFVTRIMPSGALFSPKGPGVFISGDEQLWGLLGFLNSSVACFFIEMLIGGGDSSAAGTAARDISPSLIERLPVPTNFSGLLSSISASVRAFHSLLRRYKISETDHDYRLKVLDWRAIRAEAIDRWEEYENHVLSAIDLFVQVESAVKRAFSITGHEELELSRAFGRSWGHGSTSEEDVSQAVVATFLDGKGFSAQGDSDERGSSRFATKLSYLVDPRYEGLAAILGTTPAVIAAARKQAGAVPISEFVAIASDRISVSIGIAFGRWDIRYATGEQAAPELPDPFAPLPVCPPSQLQNSQGLPARPEDVPAAYPVRIPWDGILVDDPNHPLDLERRIREVIEIIWSSKESGTTALAIEHEACEIIGVKTLREYFRKPACFFANHLSRYSKSRRQAPIYWQLSVGNGTYSTWLYYHRFTQDTLYRVLRDFVEPRIQQTEREQFELETQGALSGESAIRLQETQTLLKDLRLLKSELDLVAPLWNPNLNDGVIINHAILWRITPYTPWQKKCKECWDKLVKGDYDWAHLAFHLWPERVIPKCVTDRSLAIAHGLEERLWQETNNGNWLPRQLSEADLQALIAEHSNPAVKSALERFLAAPPPVAPTRTRASRSTRSTGSATPRRARGSAAVVDAEATRQVLLALTAAPSDGLAKTQIADLIGVEANALTAVIKQLKESGQIDQLGERRGARYVLSEQGRMTIEKDVET